MSVTVRDIYLAVDSFAPFASQCDWDNSGLLLGDAAKPVRRIGFALDLTAQTLAGALASGVDLLLTHHPVIFRGLRSLRADDPVYALVRHDIAVISCHTPWDCADGGVNDALCAALELQNVQKTETAGTVLPMLRLGRLKEEITPQAFAAFAAEKLHTTVRLASCGKSVRTVAVCGGAAMEFCEAAKNAGADLFLTGDAKHHAFLDAVQCGISVAAAGHFETERLSMAQMLQRVQAAFPALDCVLLEEQNPIEFFTCGR